MAGLRRARRRHALLIGLCDLDGLVAARAGHRGAHRPGRPRGRSMRSHHLLARGRPARRGRGRRRSGADSGVFVLGMGKLGAGELNYSSDIDLIVLFDHERLRYRGSESPMAFCVRLARGLVYLLETKTKDGYVFRTDLRLRPHPPGHPLALSIEDAELYYERHGQNWERAALIKARAVAGDARGRRRVPRGRWCRSSGAAPRLCGDPRHPLDQAPDQRLSRLRHDPRARPRPQGRPRRHPRDRVLRPDPAADPGRPRARAAARRRPAPRWRRWPSGAGSSDAGGRPS